MLSNRDPRYIEALWQLHKEKGGGWHREEEIQARALLVNIAPKLPPLPLPPLPLPPLPRLPTP